MKSQRSFVYIRGQMNSSQPVKSLITRWNILLAGLVTVTVVAFVFAWAFRTWPGDEALLAAVQGRQSPPLTAFFKAVTLLGWYPVAAAATLAAVALLLLRKRLLDALLVAGCSTSALGSHLLKEIIGRPRPEYAIIDPIPQNFGFPSGHACFAMLLVGALIYLFWRQVESLPLRRGMCAGLGLIILGVGISRVYLGVHWPSDVLGGYLYGGLVLLVAVRLRNYFERRCGGEPDKTPLY